MMPRKKISKLQDSIVLKVINECIIVSVTQLKTLVGGYLPDYELNTRGIPELVHIMYE